MVQRLLEMVYFGLCFFGKYVANQTGRLKKVATDTM